MTRILLRDLTPGTDYAVQLRANGGDIVSQWSRKFPVTTTSDTTPPTVPAWISPEADAWAVDGDTFVAQWVGIDMGLAQNMDFSHYEITMSDGVDTVSVKTTNTIFVLSFEQNRAFFGSPGATVTAKIRSVDLIGNASAYNAELSETNPAPAAVGYINATELYDAIELNWETSAEIDFDHYILQVSTTGVGGSYSTVYSGPNSQFTHSTSAFATDHYYKVFVFDKFGSASTGVTSGAVRPKSTFALDTTPPDNPDNVVATPGFDDATQQSFIDVTWDANVESDLDHYVVRYSKTAGNWTYVSVDGSLSGVRIAAVQGSQYYVAVAATDYSANLSGFTNATVYPVTATADTTAPSKPSAPSVAASTMQIQVIHDGQKDAGGDLEPDVAHFEVYASSTTGFTPGPSNLLGTINNGPAIVGTFSIPAEAGSGAVDTWFVVVKAVDFAGNTSVASDENDDDVILIDTLNIGDLAVTTAKINDLEVNKLTAGTGIIADLTVKSELTIGDASNNGVIQSYDYVNSSGLSGFYLDKDELIIRSGEISAAAIRLKDGVNLMYWPYSDFELDQDWVDENIFGSDAILTVDDTDLRYNLQSLKVVTSGGVGTWNFSPQDYNFRCIDLEPSTDYLLSYWAMVKSADTALTPTPTIVQEIDGGYDSLTCTPVGSATIADDGIWKRYVFEFSTNSDALGGAFVRFDTTVNTTIYFDGFQVEKKIGISTTPQPWRPAGGTAIDGASIVTGQMQSFNLVDINGVILPAWAISMEGSAQFANLLIRGDTIVGADSAEGEESHIKSYNYAPGVSGWSINSDGSAEFRNVVIDGSGVEPGTLKADAITTGTLHATADVIVEGVIRAQGDMGEDVSLDGDGFHVLGPYEGSISNKARTGGIATITTTLTHGFVAGNKVVVEVTGDPIYDAGLGGDTVTINSVTANTFTYNIADGSTETTTAASGRVQSFSTAGTLARPVLIEFPTDGRNPNIISGVLIADYLTINDGASIHGTSELERSAQLILNESLSAPRTSPIVTAVYDRLTFEASDGYLRTGVTVGDNSNYFVSCLDGSYNYVTEHNADGERVAQRTIEARSGVIGLAAGGTEWHVYTKAYYGIVYSSSHNKYYVGIKTQVDRYTVIGSGHLGDPFRPNTYITSDISHGIHTYNTSWTLQNIYTIGFAAGLAYLFIANGLGWDHTTSPGRLLWTSGLVGSPNTITTVGIDGGTGYPNSNIGTINIAGTNSTGAGNAQDWPVFIARTDNADALGNDRYYTKNAGVYDFYDAFFIATDTSGNLNANEFWITPDAATSAACFGGYYDETDDRFYAMIGNTLHKFEGGESFWGGELHVTNKALTSNVATLTTSLDHGIWKGQTVVVSGVDATFNGTFVVTDVPSSTTFKYAKTASNVGSTAATGTAKITTYNRHIGYSWYDGDATGGTHESDLSPRTLINLPKRSKMKVTISPVPVGAGGTDDPSMARVYIAVADSEPSLTSGFVSNAWYRRDFITSPVKTIIIDPYSTLSGSPNGTGDNDFASLPNDPAQIINSAETSFWKGDGTAQFVDVNYYGDDWYTCGGGGTINGIAEPALVNSWVNFDTSTYNGAQFRKEGRKVILRGLIKSGTTSPGTTIFTLPVGFRPLKINIYAVENSGSHGRVDAMPAGNVIISSGGNTFLSLDGIEFFTD